MGFLPKRWGLRNGSLARKWGGNAGLGLLRRLGFGLRLGGMIGILLAILICSGHGSSLQAQTSQAPVNPAFSPTLQVGTRILPPFVTQEGAGDLSGFSIELWQSLAREIDLKSTFKVYPNVQDLLRAVETREVDVAIAAITINSDRAQRVDFSQPIFSSGLQIMVRHPRLDRQNQNFLRNLATSALPKLVVLALLIIGAMAHLVWLIERYHHDPMISSAYFPGIFQALWWTATGLAGEYGDMPRGVVSRLIALFWMFASVGFVAYFTAAFTSALTVQQLQGGIQGLVDLPGHTVATTAGSTAATFLQERKIKLLERDSLEEVYAALMDREADAVVFDSGVLAYYANREGQNLVRLVGEVFKPENYGIAVSPGNPLGKAIDVALLKLKEDGTYNLLYDKYFKQE